MTTVNTQPARIVIVSDNYEDLERTIARYEEVGVKSSAKPHRQGNLWKYELYYSFNSDCIAEQLQKKEITENGEYEPDEGYKGFKSIEVKVPSSANLQTKTITENGTYKADKGYDGLGSVEVNVPEVVREIEVPVEVERIVEVPAQPILQEKTITENGEYSADEGYDGLSSVVVDVPNISKLIFNESADILDIVDYSYIGSKLDEIEISSKVKYIGLGAFKEVGIKKISFPEGSELEIINSEAFTYNNIEELDLSNCKKLKYIYSSAFTGNPLRSIILPETEETCTLSTPCFGYWEEYNNDFYDRSFENAGEPIPETPTIGTHRGKHTLYLDTLIIPENISMKTAGGLAVYNVFTDFNIRKLIIKKKDVIGSFSTCTFSEIWVPYSEDHSILNAYKTATYWRDYTDIIFESDPE